jgi:hypothetical protein
MKADLLRLPVLHADETPVAMLAPGTGKTHRAYLWPTPAAPLFVELHLANKSMLAAAAIEFIGQLYGIEREVKDLPADDRLRKRRTRAAPVAQVLHKRLLEFRPKVPDGSATAKAIDYSLHRWSALARYLVDPALPIDNDFDEQQIRPWATGRKNWLFAGTLLAGQRAAAIMSLTQTAKLNGIEPYAYLHGVLTRLPSQRARDIAELLPYRWMPTALR